MDFIFLSKEFAQETKKKIKEAKGVWRKVGYELREKAEEQMGLEPLSVTFDISPAASGNPHDYYSEAPYLWPDPQDPNAPYITRDGERNPNRFRAHREGIETLANAVMFLSYAGYYLEEKKYLNRAAELIKVWFVDPRTKMNPHLEYAQAIRNRYTGRHYGIIEVKRIDQIVHAACFIGQYPDWMQVINAFKGWLSEFLIWLTTSEKGIEESKIASNHGSWWAVHVTTLAAFTESYDKMNEMFEFYKNKIIPVQMDTDGSFPRELGRTLAFHYELSNLEALTLICEAAFHKGVDLWNYKTEDGRGIKLAIRFLLPFLDNPYLWKYPQINGEVPPDQFALQLAAVRLGMKECTKINEKRRGDVYLIRYEEPLGPLILMPGSHMAMPKED